jgi:hypothetical protein
MGTLTYHGERFSFDDRTLAHLQAVLTLKLRRREPFLLSWLPQGAADAARISLWIDNAIPIRYDFDETDPGRLNDAWLNSMVEMAGRASGLLVTVEPTSRGADRDRRERPMARQVAGAGRSAL